MIPNERLIAIDAASLTSSEMLIKVLASTDGDFICIARRDILSQVNFDEVLDQLAAVDIIHSGLQFEGAASFIELQLLTFNWNFLVPEQLNAAHTWRATSDFVCFSRDLMIKMNGFVPGLSVNAALMEFCYRTMVAGGNVKYVPISNLSGGPIQRTITASDQLYFAKHHLGSKACLYLRTYYFFSHLRFPRISSHSPPAPLNTATEYEFRLWSKIKTRVVGPYTAIIPTIDRYDYIQKSISSLLHNDFPPAEIIVVDQTPLDRRNSGIYESFLRSGVLRVFYLDEPGQSTSRNRAISEAQNSWLLFFEDDTEAWPDMMKEHIALMEQSNADVSTGVSLAPWKNESFIPESKRKYHITDVLATGNCFMSKATALSVGGLHLAFNRGAGADDDFGKRLFLAGKMIVFNYKAIQTHYKAPKGGMRTYGAWWRNTSSLGEAYPPPSQYFMLQKYYPSSFRKYHLLLFYLMLKKRTNIFRYTLMLVLAPIKIAKSRKIASKLLDLKQDYQPTRE